MSRVAIRETQSTDVADAFLAKRYARQELLLAVTQLISAGDEGRSEKCCLVHAAREYLEGDAALDAHRSKTSRTVLQHKAKRAELLTAVWMVASIAQPSSRALDLIVRAFGDFLRGESER